MSDTKDDEMPVPKTLEEANLIINDLRAAIGNMDAISQDACRKIESISRLVISSLHSPEGASSLNIIDIVLGLKTINELAQNSLNNINVIAEGELCSSRDEEFIELKRVVRSKFQSTYKSNVGLEEVNHG